MGTRGSYRGKGYVESADFRQGTLHQLLVQKLPEEYVRNDHVLVTKLAAKLGLASYTVYKWLNREHLSAKSARQLVAFSEETQGPRQGALSRSDLFNFII